MSEEKLVEIGLEAVVIDKLFGPTCFAKLRIRPDMERGGWVVERQTGSRFVEWVVIPAQLAPDFDSCALCGNDALLKCEVCGRTSIDAGAEAERER